jgi:hypothetical protein
MELTGCSLRLFPRCATFCYFLGPIRSTGRKQQSAYMTFICRNVPDMLFFYYVTETIRWRHPWPPSAPPIGILVLGIIISRTIKFRANIKILVFPFFIYFIPLSSFTAFLFFILSAFFRAPQLSDSLHSFLVSSLSPTHFLIILLRLQLIGNSVVRMWREINNALNHKTLLRTAYKKV